MTTRAAILGAGVAMVLALPGPAKAQAGSIDVFGGGFPGDSASGTGGLTRWWTERWGIGVWYSALEREERSLAHVVAPSIRWRIARNGEPLSLEIGLRPVHATNYHDLNALGHFVPTADLFMGYRWSSSFRLQAGGFYYIDSFVPTLGMTWTLR